MNNDAYVTDFRSLADFIAATKRGQLTLECQKVLLRQRTRETPITFEGTGCIRQDAAGKLKIEVPRAQPTNTNAVSWLNAAHRTTAGTLIPEEHYYSLTATTTDGIEWTAEKVSIKPSWNFKDSVVDVSGELRELVAVTNENNAGHWLQLHYFGDVNFLSAIARIDFPIRDYTFEVQQSGNELVVRVDCTSTLPEHFCTRIEEVLMFLLARTVSFRARVAHNAGRQILALYSTPSRPVGVEGFPPIALNRPDLRNDVVTLFGRYLEFAENETSDRHWTRCTYYLHNAREAMNVSIDAWAVGLGVAVEGMSNYIELPIREDDKRTIKKLRQDICAYLESRPEFFGLRERVDGLLNMLTQGRVQDRLAPLAKDGRINRDHIIAWKKMRNKQVHPRPGDLERATSGDYKELFDLIKCNTVLLHQIVFHMIDYKGKFTDYAADDFPEREYPLVPPA